MGEFWGLIVASGIGALAWIYQQAWDRQEVRIERYQAIIDLLSGFTQDHLSPDEIDEALREIRRLWLFAPDDVIKAGNAFIEAVEKGETKRPTLAKFVLAMHRDSSLRQPWSRASFATNSNRVTCRKLKQRSVQDPSLDPTN